MKLKLHHPLWTHVPAFVELLVLGGALGVGWHLGIITPTTGIDSYFLAGNDYAYPRWLDQWGIVVRYPVLALYLFAASCVYDELWARLEPVKKRFNDKALLDEALIGVLVWSVLSEMAKTQGVGMLGILAYAIPLIAVGSAVICERLRPWKPAQGIIPHDETRDLEIAVAEDLRQGRPWVYWEQLSRPKTPLVLMTIGSSIGFVPILFFLVPSIMLPMCVVLLCVGAVLLASWQRVTITKERIRAQKGGGGFTIDIASLREVKVADARVMAQEGMPANPDIPSSADIGVLVFTPDARYFLLSNHPQRLATVIRTVKEYAEEMRG